MKILQVNTVCGKGSTGRIAVDIAERAKKNNYEVCVAYGRGQTGYENSYRIGCNMGNYIHAGISRLTDRQGLYSKKSTERFIDFMEMYKPDVVHLHNIHGYYINYKMLFKYLKKSNLPVVWTLHDCWAFTGHCVYFELTNCNKWETGCVNCPEKKEYPTSYILDHSKENYEIKKELFTSLDKLSIVTCSHWLEGLVRKSFLSGKNIRTIHNGIDLNVFRPSDSSVFRRKYNLEGKKILLGVADGFDEAKGLYEFVKLSKDISNDYVIVLVGCEEKLSDVPNIITIPRTQNLSELIEIYSAADIFLNLTLSDNFPTVNLEALACGLPIITYNTGGSPESIDRTCGFVVEQHDISGLLRTIPLAEKIPKNNCLDRAKQFDKNCSFDEYLNLYEAMV